jgi:hypothetical protein
MKIQIKFIVRGLFAYVVMAAFATIAAYTLNYFIIDFTNVLAIYPHYPEALAVLEGTFFGAAMLGLVSMTGQI